MHLPTSTVDNTRVRCRRDCKLKSCPCCRASICAGTCSIRCGLQDVSDSGTQGTTWAAGHLFFCKTKNLPGRSERSDDSFGRCGVRSYSYVFASGAPACRQAGSDLGRGCFGLWPRKDKLFYERACSYALATFKIVSSSHIFPMIWRPTGKPSDSPHGIEIAGMPATFAVTV